MQHLLSVKLIAIISTQNSAIFFHENPEGKLPTKKQPYIYIPSILLQLPMIQCGIN
jgi:hypothetical protein